MKDHCENVKETATNSSYQSLLFEGRYTSIKHKHRLDSVCEQLADPVEHSHQVGIWQGAILAIPVPLQHLEHKEDRHSGKTVVKLSCHLSFLGCKLSLY